MLRNLMQKIKAIFVLAPQTVTADVLSAAVDLKHYRSMGFIVNVGAFAFTGVNKVGLEIHESDDNSTYTLATDVAGAVQELNAGAHASACHLIEYKGHKRYIKLNLNVSGTVSAPMSAVAISADPDAMPHA